MADASSTLEQRRHAIEWSVASRALPGQSVSGDLHVVVPTADGALIGVIDGLGHGDGNTGSFQSKRCGRGAARGDATRNRHYA